MAQGLPNQISALIVGVVLIAWIVSVPVQAASSDDDAARATAQTALVIEVRRQAQHLRVDWRFAEPVRTFEFSGFEAERQSRLADWDLAGQGWSFDGRVLSRSDGAEFDSFTAEISPTTTLRYPGYAVAARIGETGWVIHVGGLASQRNSDFQVVFPKLPTDHVVVGSGSADYPRAQAVTRREFIFVGPATQVADDGMQIIMAQGEPLEALYGAFRPQLAYAYGRLHERLGPMLIDTPIVSLSYQVSTTQRGIKGSVDRSFIALNVIGHEPERFTALAEGELLMLVNHEVFHLWNGMGSHRGRAQAPAWLLEGGADYVAALLGTSLDRRGAELQDRLNRCLIAIGPRSVRSSGLAQRGRTPYHCGAIVMLFADAAVRQADQGDILSIWSQMLEEEEPGQSYGEVEFFRAVSSRSQPDGVRVSAAILDGWQLEDTDPFQDFLRRADIILEPYDTASEEAPDSGLAVDVLRAVLRGTCDAGFGIQPRSDYLVLDPRQACGGVVGPSISVVSINGVDLIQRPRAAFETARSSCREGAMISIGDRVGEREVELPCSQELLLHPGLFQIMSLGRLAEPL